MPRFWGTVAFRLALSYGLLAIGSMSVISAAFYFGTVGVLERSTDGKLVSLSKRLAEHFDSRGDDGLRQEIQQLLADGIEQDTEVYLLVAPDGRKMVGNIYGWTQKSAPLDSLTDLAVMRNGRPSLSRLLPRLLPDGSILVVGRDLQDQREIERLVRRLLVLATVGSAGPFIGLFGTVWGIMTSFQAIAASKNTSLAVVAPGIAEALFATAIGLVAAIPATIFYNKFSSEVNKQAQRLEGFADEFAAILSRQIDERA